MRRRAYRATDVKNVSVEEVLKTAPAGAATAGLDIGKYELRAVVRWKDGSFERPWKVENPSEIERLVGLLRKVAEGRPLIVAMESTGTYGDAVRAKLDQGGLEVHRVGGKAAHDYAEVFDGVPSQHDGKDAAVIAELAAFGKSASWPYRQKSEADADMAYWADWLDGQQTIQRIWTGRLESLLARHWPEATRLLDLASVTLLRALMHYGGPAKLAGDPCGEAYRKAMGLNLKERSSGKYQGQLKITKRGPSIVRRWMYFAAMRTSQSAFVQQWFEAKKAKDKDRGKGALIAVARKLALALHAVGARGQAFDPRRLFSPNEVLMRKARQAERRALRAL